jgi:hypothetical protein
MVICKAHKYSCGLFLGVHRITGVLLNVTHNIHITSIDRGTTDCEFFLDYWYLDSTGVRHQSSCNLGTQFCQNYDGKLKVGSDYDLTIR